MERIRFATLLLITVLYLILLTPRQAGAYFDCSCTCSGWFDSCSDETQGCSFGEDILCLDQCCKELKIVTGCVM